MYDANRLIPRGKLVDIPQANRGAMTMYDVTLSTSHFPAQNDADIRDITVGGLLREVATSHPDAVGIVDVADSGDSGQSWTYAEILAQAERLARAPRHPVSSQVKGSSSGHPIFPSGFSWNMPAVWRGWFWSRQTRPFRPSELRYVLEQSGAVGLFMVDGFRGNPMAAIAREATKGNTRLREVVNLEDGHALYAHGERPAVLPDVQPDDAAQIQYTSGTTGFPKGAVLSHKNLVNNARLFCARKQVGPHSVWANFMPLFHTAGCATGALGCLQAAAKMLLIKRFDADVFARLIEEQGVTTCFCRSHHAVQSAGIAGQSPTQHVLA
jgi:fatty-acyl-CoA synthase